MIRCTPIRAGAAVAVALAALPVLAHTGHAEAHAGAHALGFVAGLAHPFGLDHLLAMLAVGLWAARVFDGAARAIAPALFVVTLMLGGALGFGATAPHGFELAIAATVLLLGALLALGGRLPRAAGLALVAGAGVLHGYAHGVELPAGAAALAYMGGFALTSSALHAAGLALGAALTRRAAGWPAWAAGVLGVAGAGLMLAA